MWCVVLGNFLQHPLLLEERKLSFESNKLKFIALWQKSFPFLRPEPIIIKVVRSAFPSFSSQIYFGKRDRQKCSSEHREMNIFQYKHSPTATQFSRKISIWFAPKKLTEKIILNKSARRNIHRSASIILIDSGSTRHQMNAQKIYSVTKWSLNVIGNDLKLPLCPFPFFYVPRQLFSVME